MNRRNYAVLLAALLSVGLSFLNGCASSSSSQPPPPTVAITATSGAGQTTTVGAAFGKPLVVTVTSGGSPSAGVTVTFTAPATQPNGTFTGAVATDTETTDANGVATTSKAFTAGTKAGTYSVSASATGATTPASFSLSNSAGAAAAISVTSGGTQSAAVSTAFATALQATVVDSDSNPVSGVVVTFTAPATGASGTFSTSGKTTETDTTGTNGVATASALKANGTTGGPYTVTANFTGDTGTAAKFSLTNTAAPVPVIAVSSGSGQSETISTAFAKPLVALVTTNGTPTSGVSVTFTAPASGASGKFGNGTNTETDTTNASGLATSSTFTANATTGGPYTVAATTAGAASPANFSETNTAAPVPVIAVSSGSGQSETISTAFAKPLVALVTKNGTPTSGVSVTFTAPASGASGKFGNGTNTETDTTNASGLATSSTFTANATTGGPYTVAATTAGAASPANFSETNTAAPVPVIAVSSGSGQSETISTAFAKPLVALVTTNGTPTSGVSVTFTAPASGASGKFGNGTNTETDTTNASGLATSSTFTANATTGGPYTVAATTTGAAASANFGLTNSPKPSTYTFYLSGQEKANASNGGVISYYAIAGVVRIDSDGNVVAGEQDYNDAAKSASVPGITSPQPSGDTITGGTLSTNGATGQGKLTLITNNPKLGVAGTETFAVQFANINHALIMQFDGTATSSGSMDLQTTGTPTGNFAYTLSGVDSGYNQTAEGGVFTITGTSVAGKTDQNDNGTVTSNQAFTGTLSGADSFGRGTLTITGSSSLINYYVVGPEVIRLIQVNTNSGSVGSAFGQGAGSFTSASLGTSVLAMVGNPWANGNATAGQFSTSNHSSSPSNFAGVGDDNEMGNGTQSAPAAAIAGTYTVAANGDGSMAITSANLGNVANLKIYMTDPVLNLNDPNNANGGGGALVLEMDSILPGTTGVIVPQTDTATASVAGNYAMGAQDTNNFAAFASPSCTQCEFDMVSQGTITGGVLAATGDVSDPLETLMSGSGLYPGSTFNGTLAVDATHHGRYSPTSLAATINGTKGSFGVVTYQASGEQLFWIEVDSNGIWLGPLQRQGSLAGLP